MYPRYKKNVIIRTGEIMKKRKNSSNWKAVLIVALIFICVGILTYIVHTQIPKKVLKKTNNNVTEKKTNIQNNNKEESNKNEKEESKKQETEKFEDQEGNEVEITGDKIVGATGFAGASNYKFYLKDGTLFFRNISNKENKEEIIATGVKDLYLENKEVIAELSENGNIVKENNYITYKKQY